MSNTDKLVSLTGLSRVLNSIKQMFNKKQDTLMSGTNIKTINGKSILGSGNITIETNPGTITGISVNGTSVATSGSADIPAASTSTYGVARLSSSTTSTSTTEAATPSAVKAAYDLAGTKQDKLTSGTNIKTINGNAVLGSGNIDVVGKIDLIDTNESLDDVNVSYATTAYVDNKFANIDLTDYATTDYVDGLIGDINSVLESIIGGGTTVRMIKFIIGDVEYQAEEGMTWEQWINSEYNTSFELYSVDPNYIVRVGSSQFVYDNFNNRNIAISDIIRANYEYTLKGMSIDPISL